jgi:DUF1680 family protein
MLGGYTWAAKLDEGAKTINLDVYMLLSASRTIELPNGESATVIMKSEMPWNGQTQFKFKAPEGWSWRVRLPQPEYAEAIKVSEPTTPDHDFLAVELASKATIDMSFDLPIQLLASHPLTGQDNLTIRRGPIVYVAESIDNESIESTYPHFGGLGIKPTASFTSSEVNVEGLNVVTISVGQGDVFAAQQLGQESAFGLVTKKQPARSWKKLDQELKLVPWFARANRGGKGHVRASLLRVEDQA